MPGISGKEIVEAVQKDYPEMKVLFMSGYTDDIIASHGVRNDGVFFFQKPFSVDEFAHKVREVLDYA